MLGLLLRWATIAAAVALPTVCCAAEGICLGAQEREWLQRTYAEYSPRYDPPTAARQFLEIHEAAQALRDRLSACRNAQTEPGAEDCDPLRQELDAKLGEQGLAGERLNAAFGMQSFLATLQLRLERPACQK